MPYIHFDHIGEDPPQGLNLVAMSGREAISELFHYELILESAQSIQISPTDIIGQDISLQVDYFNIVPTEGQREARYIHGIVNSFKIIEAQATSGIRRYLVELVPALWFLTKKSHFQVFENSKSSDIIKKILSENGINTAVPAGKIQREHCIQYMENDYEFVTRLMADEGFIFYFEHTADEHKLVIKDTNQYMSAGTLTVGEDVVSSWSPRFTFISGKWDCGDYSYSSSAESLAKSKSSKIKGLDNTKHVQVLTAAGTAGEGDAATLARQVDILSEREDATYEVIEVSSEYNAICAGASFKIGGTDYLPKNTPGEVVVIEATHKMDAGGLYSNNFFCIPAQLAYRGKQRMARPVVQGPMTAKVVESGDDPLLLGRVKVTFLYEGPDSIDTNSCWIRVAQVIAGPNYAAMFTPNIDDEVVVTFINGNPDRPIITGSLYNKTNKPPKDYVEKHDTPTRNGFVSPFNELYFEDKSGEELFHISANKDFERLVEENDTLTINKGERKILINDGDESTTLKNGNQKISLEKGNQEVKLDNGDILLESSAKNIKMKAGKNVEADATSTIKLTATSKIELKVGGNTMTMDSMGITLKVGGNSVKIEQSGVTVKGIMVKVEGSAQAELKAPMATVSGDGMLTVKGGVVMIN